MGFKIILEDDKIILEDASPLENLLSKFTSFNFRKSETYPGKSSHFHWDTETEVF